MRAAAWTLLLLAAALPARAITQNTGTTAAEFLRLGAGARSLGMGDASAAVAEGPEAIYWNPAGLGQMSRPEVQYARSELAAGLHHDFLAVGIPSHLLAGTLALGVTRLSQESLTLVNASNQNQGSFSPHSEAYALAYGHQFSDNDPAVSSRDYFRENWNLPRVDRPYQDERDPWTGEIAVGGSAKFVSESLGTRRASAFAVDGGFLYRPSTIREFSLAGAVRNLGSKMRFISESSPLPAELALGAAYDLRVETWRLLPALEVDVPYAGAIYGKAGFEASVPVASGMSAAARLGYTSRTAADLGPLSGLTAGVGLRAGGFSFDAAFQPMGVLGSGLRVGAGWKF